MADGKQLVDIGTDTLSLAAAVATGPQKNFHDVLIISYYKDREAANNKLLDVVGTKPDGVRLITESFLDFIPEKERYFELYNMIDTLNDDYLSEKVKDPYYIQKYQVKFPKDLPEDVKLEAMRRACRSVRYEVQLSMNSAHGLIKERGLGCGFPFYSEGRFIFPMRLVPPDGSYVRVDFMPKDIRPKQEDIYEFKDGKMVEMIHAEDGKLVPKTETIDGKTAEKTLPDGRYILLPAIPDQDEKRFVRIYDLEMFSTLMRTRAGKKGQIYDMSPDDMNPDNTDSDYVELTDAERENLREMERRESEEEAEPLETQPPEQPAEETQDANPEDEGGE